MCRNTHKTLRGKPTASPALLKGVPPPPRGYTPWRCRTAVFSAIATVRSASASGLNATVQAINPDAKMTTSVPYREGPVAISSSHSDTGYLERTGYHE